MTTPIPGGSGRFVGFHELAFDGGNLLFIGSGPEGQSSVYKRSSIGKLGVIADTLTRVPGSVEWFSSFSAPALDGNRVAFHARTSGGRVGIYFAEPGGALRQVIATGDQLEGKEVRGLDFESGWLKDGTLAFRVFFADGSRAIYLVVCR